MISPNNDEHQQDYANAHAAQIGADRMAMGLACIPHPIKGDMERLAACEAERQQLMDQVRYIERSHQNLLHENDRLHERIVRLEKLLIEHDILIV